MIRHYQCQMDAADYVTAYTMGDRVVIRSVCHSNEEAEEEIYLSATDARAFAADLLAATEDPTLAEVDVRHTIADVIEEEVAYLRRDFAITDTALDAQILHTIQASLARLAERLR